MNWRRIAAACMALALAGCASAPRKAFDRDASAQVHRILLVEYPEPVQYQVFGVQAIPTAGGVAMMVLGGAIGGAIVGGIEASHAQSRATSLTGAIKPYADGFCPRLYSGLEARLRERGYEVTRIERPLKKSADEVVDYSSVANGADAVVEVSPTLWGYRKVDDGFQPLMGVRAQMVGITGAPVRYAQAVTYGTGKSDAIAWIAPEGRFTFADLEQLYASGQVAAEALQAGADLIAARIASDL